MKGQRYMQLHNIRHPHEFRTSFLSHCVSRPRETVLVGTGHILHNMPWTGYSFFTCWALTLHMLPARVRPDTFLLALVVSIAGGYITYVHPRCIRLRFNGVTFLLSGPMLVLIDLLFHHLPLICIVAQRRNFGTSHGCLLVLLLYTICFDVPHTYDIAFVDVCIIAVVCSLVIIRLAQK